VILFYDAMRICWQLIWVFQKIEVTNYIEYSYTDYIGIYHLFTETEGNSVFCGSETAVFARGEDVGNNGGRGPQNTLFSRGLSK
jgi:hypothetical protein